MALTGTLADLGIIDLMQFPHAGRKTGELIITDGERTARLAYEKGNLVHAVLDDHTGMEALVDLVGWTAGSFEFSADVIPGERTIESDLHRTVMHALKVHDERKMEEEQRKNSQAEEPESNAAALNTTLAELIQTNEHALHVAVLGPDGSVLGAANSSRGAIDRVAELYEALHGLVITYPREGLNRVILDDTAGTVVLTPLDKLGSLVVVASKEAPLGAVAMSVSRMAGAVMQQATR